MIYPLKPQDVDIPFGVAQTKVFKSVYSANLYEHRVEYPNAQGKLKHKLGYLKSRDVAIAIDWDDDFCRPLEGVARTDDSVNELHKLNRVAHFTMRSAIAKLEELNKPVLTPPLEPQPVGRLKSRNAVLTGVYLTGQLN